LAIAYQLYLSAETPLTDYSDVDLPKEQLFNKETGLF